MVFRTRTHLVLEGLRALGLKRGVEVGFREGNLSRLILSSSDMTLTGVDTARHERSLTLEEEYPGRFEAVMEASPASAGLFPDGHFDFVHIDADHSLASVRADLSAWWPKLAPGGLFSGDDYCVTACPSEGRYGVMEAVNEFADCMGLTLFVTGVGSACRAIQLAAGQFHGTQSYNRHAGLPWEPYDVPAWYIFKPTEAP